MKKQLHHFYWLEIFLNKSLILSYSSNITQKALSKLYIREVIVTLYISVRILVWLSKVLYRC